MHVGCLKITKDMPSRASLQREGRVSTKTRTSRPKEKQRLQARIWATPHSNWAVRIYNKQCEVRIQRETRVLL